MKMRVPEGSGLLPVCGFLEGMYTLHETIGRGGFAKVKKATHLITGERVAIKILDKASLGVDLPRISREIETLKTLNNPYICKLYHVFETPEKIFMVMEYCRGGELFDYIVQRDRLDEAEAKRIFRQIAVAVSYIHGRGIAHRDLKPENILLDGTNNVKLIDFGLCAAPEGGLSSALETCCGSPAYAAPELIKGQRYIGTSADVWSLGVLLYALLCGRLPFDDPNLTILYGKIQEGKYAEPRYLSEGSKNILRCMLQVDPNYRLTVGELLSHTWCQEGKPLCIPNAKQNMHTNELDEDVILLMSSNFHIKPSALKSKIMQWKYDTQEVATYLMLLDRKNNYGERSFRSMGFNVASVSRASPYIPQVNFGSIQKSLESEFSECDSLDSVLSTPVRLCHSSMEGGLDDCSLLQMGSPKVDEEKENHNDFSRPRIPSPKKQPKYLENDNRTATMVANSLSPARSVDSICVLTDGTKTPRNEKWRGNAQTPVNSVTPSRRKVLGSIERGMDKIRLMLTPKTGNKHKTKLKTIHYHGKSAFNISVTSHADPDCLIAELKSSLLSSGIDCKQKGYRLLGKVESRDTRVLKFELEVVAIDELNRIGIRRKRQQGDAWAYKRIIEQVLTLSHVSETIPVPPVKPSLVVQTPVKVHTMQTMV